MPLKIAQILLSCSGVLSPEKFENAGHMSTMPVFECEIHVSRIEIAAAVELARLGQDALLGFGLHGAPNGGQRHAKHEDEEADRRNPRAVSDGPLFAARKKTRPTRVNWLTGQKVAQIVRQRLGCGITLL